MHLSGKLVLVTGASRGIGRALAVALARCDCHLLLTALEPEELDGLLDELRAFPVACSALVSDVSDPGSRADLLRWLREQEQPPDIVVNNVGIGGPFGRFEQMRRADIEAIVAVNVLSLLTLTREMIPLLRERPQARIVNVSSGIARLPYPGLAVYGATKAFVTSFSASLACELADSNIGVHCFFPGFTSTHFMASSGMPMARVPRWLIRPPEYVAARIVRALRRDRFWSYADLGTRVLPWLGSLIPHRLRTALFKDLFWELPHAG